MGTEIALIFGAAAQPDWGYLQKLQKLEPLVICADGGIALARQAGFEPAVFVGDCDSGGRPIADGRNILLPVRKDETDLEAAYACACQSGCKRLYLTACTGGRQDHHIAALQLLERAYDESVDATLLDSQNYITCVGAGLHCPDTTGYRYFSLLPIDRQLIGVSIRHASYLLDNATIERGSSLCVSNEAPDNRAEITIVKGKAWLICSR